MLRIVCNNERWRAAVLACHLQPDAMGGDEQEKQLHGISAVVLVLAALRNHLANCAVCAQACGALRFMAVAGPTSRERRLADSVRMQIAGQGGADLVSSAVAARGATRDCQKWGQHPRER